MKKKSFLVVWKKENIQWRGIWFVNTMKGCSFIIVLLTTNTKQTRGWIRHLSRGKLLTLVQVIHAFIYRSTMYQSQVIFIEVYMHVQIIWSCSHSNYVLLDFLYMIFNLYVQNFNEMHVWFLCTLDSFTVHTEKLFTFNVWCVHTRLHATSNRLTWINQTESC